jgi:hypothetical protein
VVQMSRLGGPDSPALSARSLKLLLDEMLDCEIAIQLRARGHDVQAIQGEYWQLKATEDWIVLEEAGKIGRAVVTDNVPHYLAAHRRLMAEEKHHSGLILASPRAYPRSKRTIGLWVRALEALFRDHKEKSASDLVRWL